MQYEHASQSDAITFRHQDCYAGGYLQYIFRVAAKELFGVDVPWDQPLPLKTLRNADYQEVSLEHKGRTVLRFALAYGFRNIQTIVSPPFDQAQFCALHKGLHPKTTGHDQLSWADLMVGLITHKMMSQTCPCPFSSQLSMPAWGSRRLGAQRLCILLARSIFEAASLHH